MTAEVGILNKEAVALAADSAVTIDTEAGRKIFTSVNKLFSLTDHCPIGIMVYGNAVFMGVPWETIIKSYNDWIGENEWDTLEQYGENLIKFLDKGNDLFPSDAQEIHVRNSIYGFFNFLKKEIESRIEKLLEEYGKVSDKDVKSVLTDTIRTNYKEWETSKNIKSIPSNFNDRIADKHNDLINKLIKEVFEDLPLTKTHINYLKKLATYIFSRFPKNVERRGVSGVVIAGFGKKDVFPKLVSYHLEGIALNRLKFQEYLSDSIGFDNNASIIPFAQREMVDTFMQGVDPFYIDIEIGYFTEVFKEFITKLVEKLKSYEDADKVKLKNKMFKLSESIIDEYKINLEEFRRTEYITPVVNVVSMLPKDELASMAEAFVNLTSLKRKVTMESETVGGPVDVAVISKSDGFVWIKRKCYFQKELN